MSTKDELRNLANDCTGLFSTFVPKQILREAADELDTKQSRIDQLETELAAVRTGKEQALFVAATEMERLETELAEARKDAERRLKIIRQVWLDMVNDDGQCGLCGNDSTMISFYAEEHQEWCAARKCKEEMEHAAIDAAMEAK